MTGFATEKQVGFIRSLLNTKDLSKTAKLKEGEDLAGFIERMERCAPELTKAIASAWIERLLSLPERVGTPVAGGGVYNAPPAPPISAQRYIKAGDWLDIPQGRYAVTGEDGTTDFYRVQRGKKSKTPGGRDWSGKLFVKLQTGSDLHNLSVSTAAAILDKIRKDGPKEAAIRYGKELGHCSHCGRELTNERSRELGIGPVCAEKLGWI